MGYFVPLYKKLEKSKGTAITYAHYKRADLHRIKSSYLLVLFSSSILVVQSKKKAN